jgi:hypothetical protein
MPWNAFLSFRTPELANPSSHTGRGAARARSREAHRKSAGVENGLHATIASQQVYNKIVPLPAQLGLPKQLSDRLIDRGIPM